ncbi:LysR family transcriptional regulator [Pseudomonas cichorii]|nr:LysR family transcriptional regulator [Pseudomonas cichorii]
MDRLTSMQVFIEIAERGSMTAAADVLEISKPMVRRYFDSLEAWLGARCSFLPFIPPPPKHSRSYQQPRFIPLICCPCKFSIRPAPPARKPRARRLLRTNFSLPFSRHIRHKVPLSTQSDAHS